MVTCDTEGCNQEATRKINVFDLRLRLCASCETAWMMGWKARSKIAEFYEQW